MLWVEYLLDLWFMRHVVYNNVLMLIQILKFKPTYYKFPNCLII